jgi:hypothetical protein
VPLPPKKQMKEKEEYEMLEKVYWTFRLKS